MNSDYTVALDFPSRTEEGDDIAAAIRRNLPDGDLLAKLDDAGAVTGYQLTLHFDDPDAATDACFRLRDFFDEMGWEVAFR